MRQWPLSWQQRLWRNRLVFGLGVYLILLLTSSQLRTLLGPYYEQGDNPQFLWLFVFSVAWMVVTLLSFCFLLGKSFVVDRKLLYMYASMMALIGPIGEVFVNSLTRFFFDQPLWTYFLYPLHGGDTSLYSALFIWPYYGVYLYFLHQKIEVDHSKKHYYMNPALFMAFDAIALEFLVNITSVIFLQQLIFFYFPSDVAHLTTAAAIPFYFLAGIVITRTIKRFSQDPQFFGTMSLLIAFVFVFLTN